MKNKAYIVLSAFIGLLLLVFVLQATGLEKLKIPFKQFSILHLILYIVLSSLMMLVITMRWSLVLKAHGYRLPFVKMILFMLAGKSISYVTPSAQVGGEAARTYLLKHSGVPTEKGLSSIIIDKIMDLTSNSIFAILALPIMILFFPFSVYLKIAMGAILLVIVFLIAAFYYQSFRGKGFFNHLFRFFHLHKIKSLEGYEQKLIDTETNVAHFFKHNRVTFRYAIFYSILTWVIMFFEFKIALLVFGYNANPIQVILALSMVGFAYMMPVPAAIGILEASEASMFTLLGINPGIGIAMSFLIRARDMVVMLLGMGSLSHYGLKIAKAASENE